MTGPRDGPKTIVSRFNKHRSCSLPGNRQGTLPAYLAANEAFARLAGQAERLRQLQALLDAALPAHLAAGTHVANLKRGKVVIHADSGAVAVKLRQLGPRLAAELTQRGQEITGIEVRVQPRYRPLPAAPQRTSRALAPHTKQSLISLAAGLAEDSPLRQALHRLLENARVGAGGTASEHDD